MLRWLLLNCVALIVVRVLWHFGVLQSLLGSDRTHISVAIAVIFAVTALHCLVQTAEISNQLVPIAQITNFEADNLRSALSGMTAGMAVALTVTVTGIASALVLKFEYFMLDNDIAELFDIITETSEIYVMSALERRPDARP